MTRAGRLRRPFFGAAAAAVALLLSACSDGVGPGIADSIAVTPTNDTLTVGYTLQISVELVDANGSPLPTDGVTWTSSNGNVANVSGSGLVAALSPGGPVTITARAGSLTAEALITVVTGSPTQLSMATQPSATGFSGGALGQQPVVQLRDAAGNPSPTSGVQVTAVLAQGQGTVSNGTTTTDPNGRATFTGLAIAGANGAYRLRFEASGLTPVTSDLVTLATPTAAALTIVTQPSTTAQSSVPFLQQPSVEARDASNNLLAGVVVTASIATGGGTIGGSETATTNASGRATFTNLAIAGLVGTRTLLFTSGSATATSGNIQLQAGPVAQLSVLTQPPVFAFSGDVFTRAPVVEVKDVSGNLVSGAQVVASIQSGGGTLGGATSVTTNGTGAATFSSLSLSGVGPRTLRFAVGSVQAISSTVNVSYGEGTQTLTYCGSQLMDVFIPAESFPRPLPVAVHIHGGAWVTGDRLSGLLFTDGGNPGALRSELLSRGYVVVSLDYRLAPASPWPAQIHDVKCAIRHLRARAGDYGADGRIVVWGSSAGGHLASLLGLTTAASGLEGNEGFAGVSSHVDAVAPIGSISDITNAPNHPELPFALTGPGADTFGSSWPGPSQVLIDASPITWASSGDAPFYIVHGNQDATVLYPQATTLNTVLNNAGGNATLLTVVNGGHNLNDVGMGTPSHTLAQVADLIADFFDLHVN